MAWLSRALGLMIHWLVPKPIDAMRKHIFLLSLVLLPFLLQAQYAKPVKNAHYTYRNHSPFSIGVTGSFAANDMIYTASEKGLFRPYLAPTAGLAMEWNTLKRIALGFDASYAMRGTKEGFATELLTSYTTMTFARVKYAMTMNAVEFRIPVTCYLGDGDNLRPYVYLAPRFDLWLNGNVEWERAYDDNSNPPLTYQTELTDATITPFDISAVVGVGLCHRIPVKQVQMLLKYDLSYGISVLNTFSEHEKNQDITFLGWGDIEHEELGKRYLQNLELRVTLLVPLWKHLKDACTFDQSPKKGK